MRVLEDSWDGVWESVAERLWPPSTTTLMRRAKRGLMRESEELRRRDLDAARKESAELALLRRAARENNEPEMQERARDVARTRALRRTIAKARRTVVGAEMRLISTDSSAAVRRALRQTVSVLEAVHGTSPTASVRELQQLQRKLEMADHVQETTEEMMGDEDEEPETDAAISQVMEEVRCEVESEMPRVPVRPRAADELEAELAAQEAFQRMDRLR